MKRALLLLLCALPGLAAGAGVLPSAEAVDQALRATPDVQAAALQLRGEAARRRQIEAGPYEWTLRVGGQRRQVQPAGVRDERFTEWDAALERPLRLAGKAELDARLGELGVAQAETALAEALHEARRELLEAWFGWLAAGAARAQWEAQADLLARQVEAVRRREALGDAARIDAVHAEAARAQAEAVLVQARAAEAVVAAELSRRYPALTLAVPAQVDVPQPLEGGEAEWVDAVLAASPALALARHETRRAQLVAGRRDRERTPDPTLGVRFSRERGGEEQVIGAYLSIPLAGAWRRAEADLALAEAEVAGRREAQAARHIAAQAAGRFQAARTAHQAWRAAQAAAEGLARAADMSERAYALGEGSLDALITARRLANEASLAARLAQLEALLARDRLLLDAQRLWSNAAPEGVGSMEGGRT